MTACWIHFLPPELHTYNGIAEIPGPRPVGIWICHVSISGPQIDLEQYPTGPHIASRILFTVSHSIAIQSRSNPAHFSPSYFHSELTLAALKLTAVMALVGHIDGGHLRRCRWAGGGRFGMRLRSAHRGGSAHGSRVRGSADLGCWIYMSIYTHVYTHMYVDIYISV